jgi:hypothetical protein
MVKRPSSDLRLVFRFKINFNREICMPLYYVAQQPVIMASFRFTYFSAENAYNYIYSIAITAAGSVCSSLRVVRMSLLGTATSSRRSQHYSHYGRPASSNYSTEFTSWYCTVMRAPTEHN